MSTSLILIVTAIYFYVGVTNMIGSQLGLGITFFCYGLANIGLILAQRGF